MATVNEWVAGARLRTLPMAVSPVLIGASAAFAEQMGHDGAPWPLLVAVAVLTLGVSLSLQVGVNYANDYSDGVRGTDDTRIGPMRLTASGTAPAKQVKTAAFICFGIAAVAGIVIIIASALWWMLPVGALCVLAAWWYTGGKRPYGYLGLGDVVVFIFFGLVATLGTTYAIVAAASIHGPQDLDFPAAPAVIGAVSQGLIASALLMANNVRDIPTDREAGKKTLAVRLGDRPARWTYALMVAIAVLLPLALLPTGAWYLLVLVSWLLCAGPVRIMLSPAHTGFALVKVLQLTGMLGLVFAVMFSAATLLSA